MFQEKFIDSEVENPFKVVDIRDRNINLTF